MPSKTTIKAGQPRPRGSDQPLGSQSYNPMNYIGTGGAPTFGGFLQVNEKDSSLVGRERYRTFSELLANISIVAAGTRYFLNLLGDADWKAEPADDSEEAREKAEFVKDVMHDMDTPWSRVVRRAGRYRFLGFATQEWTAKRRKDGRIGFVNVEPRAQQTIERWDVDRQGQVRGIVQRDPENHDELYIPRDKLIYLVDDTLYDSPEGLGLFRHLVEPSKRLKRLQFLEMTGYETDLRGVPVGRGPFSLLQKMVDDGKLTSDDKSKIEKPMKDFIENHIRTPQLGMLLDSAVYTGQDEAATPSDVYQWSLDLMRGSGAGTALSEISKAIERVNREMARILGVEQLLLGSNDRGSFALAQDKTQAFLLMVNATLKEITNSFEHDFVRKLFDLNGWDHDLMPTLKAENVQFRDVTAIAASLRDMSMAGVILSPTDPAVLELFDMMGLSRPTGEGFDASDAAIPNLSNAARQNLSQEQEEEMKTEEAA